MTHQTPIEIWPAAGSLLFAYGTLQRGGQYHYFLEQCGARFVSTGKLIIPYPLILAEYPCLLDQPGKGFRVSGEIFEIQKPEDWKAIDCLEGHPNQYIRRPETVETESTTVLAWTYFYQLPDHLDPRLKPVESFSIST
jgi:gamma-glutamylcyclotransferase (GGCT)/AIG2-like uncharacterized protein YtfP